MLHSPCKDQITVIWSGDWSPPARFPRPLRETVQRRELPAVVEDWKKD